MGRSISPRLSAADSAASDGSPRGAAAAAACSPNSGGATRSPPRAASQAASLAAVVEAAHAHRALLPGLAELVGASGGGVMGFKGAGGASAAAVVESRVMHAASEGEGGGDAMETEPMVGHPHLPSMEDVAAAASKLINDAPPFVTMSVRDTAPQLKLSSPVIESETPAGDASSSSSLQRKLVVEGGVKGYRMSRATHGVASGCYYYEAVVLGENDGAGRGVKRSFQESKDGAKENEPRSIGGNGHLRIGWSTRSADLQAPVGYNEHSYAVRDIGGSRIHKSRREDKWGGTGFGPGDVVGLAICLVDHRPADAPAPATSLGSASGEMNVDAGAGTASAKDATTDKATQVTLTDHIRFFKNGEPMGGGIAYDNIIPGTYHPSVSCYMDSAVHMNFGPHFVCPPQGLPPELTLQPISDLCPPPPLPEMAVETVISGSPKGGGSKEGKKFFSSKRTDEGVVAAFKELVKAEATARREAYATQLELHRREVVAFRKERGLPTADLAEGQK